MTWAPTDNWFLGPPCSGTLPLENRPFRPQKEAGSSEPITIFQGRAVSFMVWKNVSIWFLLPPLMNVLIIFLMICWVQMDHMLHKVFFPQQNPRAHKAGRCARAVSPLFVLPEMTKGGGFPRRFHPDSRMTCRRSPRASKRLCTMPIQ